MPKPTPPALNHVWGYATSFAGFIMCRHFGSEIQPNFHIKPISNILMNVTLNITLIILHSHIIL